MKRSLLGILVLAILSMAAFAVPNQLTYSGRLLQNGALVNATLQMHFKIYDDITSTLPTDLLWSTSNINVDVNQGIYSVVLDQVSPNVFSGDSAYLEVMVGTETLAPRTRINSVGYALQAGALTGIGNVIPTTGNVGFGTTSPTRLVQLAGANPILSFVRGATEVGYIQTVTGDALAIDVHNLAKNLLLNSLSNGKVGIGTTNPLHKLETAGIFASVDDGNFGGGEYYPINAAVKNAGAGDTGVGYGFVYATGNMVSIDGTQLAAQIVALATEPGVKNNKAHLTFKTQDWSSTYTTEKMRITSSGNVGIGTSVPVTSLDIYSASGSALKIGTPVGPAGSIRQTLVTLESSLGGYTTSIVDSNKVLFRGAGYSGAPQDTGAIVAQSQQGLSGLNARGILKFQVNNDSTILSDAMTLQYNGSLGVGITNPLSMLHVANTAGNGELRVGGTVSAYGIVITYNQVGVSVGTIYSNPNYTNGNSLLKLGVNANNNPDQLVLKGNGCVGIGTSAPGETLVVSGNFRVNAPPNNFALIFANSGGMRYNSQGDAGLTGFSYSNYVYDYQSTATNKEVSFVRSGLAGNYSTGDYAIYTKDNTAWTLGLYQKSGRVGIATSNPSQQLEVVGGARVKSLYVGSDSNFSDRGGQVDNIYVREPVRTTGGGYWGVAVGLTGPVASHTDAFYPYRYLSDEDSDGQEEMTRFYVGKDGSGYFKGNVGVATTALTYALNVAGDIRATGKVFGAGGFTDPSDLRLKKDITPLSNSLSKILELQGVNYNWRVQEFPLMEFSADKQIGLIAQDAEKVIPEIVSTDKEGYKGISYNKLTPFLVEAVKELKKEKDAEIAKLAEQNKGLQTKNSELEKRLEALEKKVR
ncbi:MAG: tail fiber domain-containing protein [Candidatus Margulisiibacteriota bacterium]|jgi:hypothetical protein